MSDPGFHINERVPIDCMLVSLLTPSVALTALVIPAGLFFKFGWSGTSLAQVLPALPRGAKRKTMRAQETALELSGPRRLREEPFFGCESFGRRTQDTVRTRESEQVGGPREIWFSVAVS